MWYNRNKSTRSFRFRERRGESGCPCRGHVVRTQFSALLADLWVINAWRLVIMPKAGMRNRRENEIVAHRHVRLALCHRLAVWEGENVVMRTPSSVRLLCSCNLHDFLDLCEFHHGHLTLKRMKGVEWSYHPVACILTLALGFPHNHGMKVSAIRTRNIPAVSTYHKVSFPLVLYQLNCSTIQAVPPRTSVQKSHVIVSWGVLVLV